MWIRVPSRVLAGFHSRPHAFKSQTKVNNFRIYSLNAKEGSKEEKSKKDMKHRENIQNGRHKSNHINNNIKCEWTV